MNARKILVAYFSASGVTANVVKTLAQAAGADLYEIRPAQPYTSADLNWMDKQSRSSLEMKDPASRPAIVNTAAKPDVYDTVFVGFPIWWGLAPTIVNTFLESCDFAGKTVIPFATSGGSGMGRSVEKLRPSVSADTKVLGGKRLRSNSSVAELKKMDRSIVRIRSVYR